jgi:hypothetical protein
MTPVQSEWIATAAYGVYYVYDVLSDMVDAVVNQNLAVGLKLKTAIHEPQLSAPDWKGAADSHLTSIDQEDSNGFSGNVLQHGLITLIDRTCQQGMTSIVHSPQRLGILSASNALPSAVKVNGDASCH